MQVTFWAQHNLYAFMDCRQQLYENDSNYHSSEDTAQDTEPEDNNKIRTTARALCAFSNSEANNTHDCI